MTTNVKIETQIELKAFNEVQLLEILTRMRDAVERLQIGLIVVRNGVQSRLPAGKQAVLIRIMFGVHHE